MAIRTLIVDDEPVARTVLREELEQFESIELIGEAESGPVALRLIEATGPELVFLDLQMPDFGGFEVVRQLKRGRNVPVFCIVTAYDQFAMAAFDSGAIDYLLKPVRQERLAEAIAKAERILLQPRGAAERFAALQNIAKAEAPKPVRRIVAKNGPEYVLLNPEEVLAFQADADLVWVVTARQKLLATETLSKLQVRLQGMHFRRIHRNSLVNVDHIRKMSPLTSQRWLLTLSNQMEFIVSKRQVKSVRELLT